MTVYGRVEPYLERKSEVSNEHRFLMLLKQIGIETHQLNTVVIPTKGVLDDWYKRGEDVENFCQVSKEIGCYLFYKALDEKTLSSGQNQFENRSYQICKFTKLTNGKFEIHSGPDLEKPEEKAMCELAKDFQAGKDSKCINTRPIAVVICKDGKISANGKINERRVNGSADDMEEEIIEDTYQSFVGASDNDKAFSRKCENFKLLSSKGKHAFTECVAGLLMYLQKTDISEFDPLKKVVASLLTYNAVATYIVLFQPYGKGSFIPPRLMTDEWCFAPARSSDYVKIFEDFVAQHAPKIDDGVRKTALREARSGMSNVAMGMNFKKIYEQYFSKIFPSDFDLTCEQALWAHEALFKMCYCDEKEMFAETYRGEDYQEESTFTNPKYIKACVGAGLYSSDSMKLDCSPKGFVNSEYFLKYTLVSEPSCCKDEMTKHSNPLDATARAFCQING
jgi:hypothetical protein